MIHPRARAVYRLLLRAYPPEFRARYGTELEDGFGRILRQESRRHGRIRWTVVWSSAVWDVASSALVQRLAGRRRRAAAGTTRLGAPVAGNVAADVRYAIRALRRNPAFAGTAVVTLALAIGANTAIFSVVNGLLIRDLPYHDGDRLVHIWSQNHQRGWYHTDIPLVDAWDFRTRTSAFDDVAAYDRRAMTLTGTEEPERLSAHGVTHNIFRVLGVPPAIGRDFVEADGRPDRPPVAILSHGFWERRLGSDPGVLGTTIHLDGRPTTVVGIMPPRFPFLSSRPDLWVPFRENPAEARRGDHSNVAVGRLRRGIDIERARAEVAQVAAALETEHPETNAGWTATVTSVQRDQLGDMGVQAALAVMVAVGLVLLMACTNVANLLLARANGRRLEMAIRSANGANRSRLLQQALTESVVLASIGGAAGLILATRGTSILARSMPPDLPPIFTFEMDLAVLAFAAALTVGAAVLFGVVPALRASRLTGSELRDGGRSGRGTHGRRFGGFLVIAQTALAVVLLTGGGIMARGVLAMSALDLGYDPGGLVAFRVSPPESRFPGPQDVGSFYDRLIERVRGTPGVEAVGSTLVLPLSGANRVGTFTLEGEDAGDPAAGHAARVNAVSPGYFETMGVELREGRGIAPGDRSGAPRALVVNETLASRYFSPGEAPGAGIWFGGERWEIVGVVADHVERGLTEPVRPALYYPGARSTARDRTMVVRATGDPSALVPTLRAVVLDLDADLPIYAVTTMAEQVTRSLGAHALIAKLMAAFAMISLMLGAVGIYGVMAYGVGQRTNEIGIRMALGAARHEVRGLVVRSGMRQGAIGVAIGLVLSLPATAAMSGLLVGVSPRDPTVFGVVTVTLLGVCFVGSWLPGRRAAAVDPTRALSQE